MRPAPFRRRVPATVVLVLLALPACGGDATGPAIPPSITVTSPVDTILARGATAALDATARDADGQRVLGLIFDWTTSDPTVATVSAVGVVTAQGAGTATITAAAQGATGSLRLRVVEADLSAVTALAADPFADALITSISATRRPTVQAAWDAIGAGAATGNVKALIEAVAELRAEVAGATDPTDRAALAVLALYADRVEGHLGI